MRHIIKILIIVINILIISSCSNEKNTWVSRNYQKLTSNYNVYFNGVEAFNSGIDKIRQNYKNDYSHVLPVYEFSDSKVAKSGSSDMETALKKGHKLIQLHSITAKPKRKDKPSERYKRFSAQEEFNPYVAESYLLLGKATVVRHEEDEAIEYFDYLSRKYEGKRPCYEGKIWKSIAYAQKGQYGNAVSALESYDLDGVAPEELYGQYMAAYANIYICQQRYGEAITYMETAVKETDERHSRRRYKYILAQLYRSTGNKAKAAPIFLELSKNMADYDMAFAAKLDLATVASTAEELAIAEKKLTKMASDDKNKDQLDQIYYSLGKMRENKGDTTSAINNFKKSISKSVDNDNQRGLSYLALADIYITIPDYIPTSEALDSAVFFLDDSNIRKEETELKSKKYQPLATELRVIREQDSLLRVANMDSKEREKLIKSIIEKYEKEKEAAEAAKQAEMDEGMSQSDFYQLTSGQMNRGSHEMSKWYFYNTATVNAGKRTFLTQWGRRKNEDNWRRNDKSSNNTSDLENVFEQKSDSANNNGNKRGNARPNPNDRHGNAKPNPNDKLGNARPNPSDKRDNQAQQTKQTDVAPTKESLLAGLPLTDEAQKESNKKIDDALFASGTILYEDIKDYKSATKQFKTQTTRFSQSENRYNSLIMLYFAQTKTGDISSAQETALIIKREFSNSSFAKYLNMPNYFEQQNIQKAELEQRYEHTYNAYLDGQYSEAISAASSALSDTTNNEYRPKYLLVRSLAYAKNAQTAPFKADLQTITEQYNGGQEDSIAKILLAKLDEGLTPVKAEPYKSPLSEAGKQIAESTTNNVETYTYRADTTHTIICLVDFEMQNKAQFVISDYNFSNYLVEDFDIKIQKLSEQHQAVIINGFENKDIAMSYFYSLREQEFWKEISSEAMPTIYVVSDNNVRMLILSDLGNNYSQFFDEYYLNKKAQ